MSHSFVTVKIQEATIILIARLQYIKISYSQSALIHSCQKFDLKYKTQNVSVHLANALFIIALLNRKKWNDTFDWSGISYFFKTS